MNLFRLACVAALACSAVPDASAFTYRMIGDEALLAQSPSVFTARIERRVPAGANADGMVMETRYDLRVSEVHKGAVPEKLVLRLPGAVDRVAGWRVAGVRRYEPGETVLVFAEADPRGVYQPTQLMLGIFRAIEHDGVRYLARDLDGGVALGKRANAAYAQARDAERFTAWIAARASGLTAATDYLVSLPPAAAAKFTLLTVDFGGSIGELPTRFRKFSQGTTETWFANADGQAGMVTDEFAQVQQALAAWSNDATSDIRMGYGGTVAAAASNQSNVVWNDPQNQISGSFNCQSGGTLAIGGPLASFPGHTHASTTFATIVEGNVVVQDGAGCAFDDNGGADGAETLTHEIGHAIGFGHSCGDSESPACNSNAALNDAVMRSFLHGDGRGASLRADDIAGAAFLYPNQAAGSTDPIFTHGFENP
ncbi:MAG TPA: hypothetical protein VND91_10445 [Candidatus Saccharimonadia bacterium]|nr:hypothetical protein [Candidatus Saccharimonadia bacterium]